jgi:DNA-binding winged helix-turn-helix (wHTH) protein/tetratricopeptide (TPR) repeat protein
MIGRHHGDLKVRSFLYHRQPMALSDVIRFDGWTLHRTSGELAGHGNTVRLPQQPLRFLLALLDRPGEVVTREQLREVLWPRGIVDFDNSLNNAARRVRVALGDDSDTPRYIETLPRVGYRFVGPIDPSPAPLPGRSLDVLWISLVAAAVLLATLFGFLWWPRTPATGAVGDPANTAAALVPRRTTSSRAYEHYLQAIYQRSRRDTNANALAIQSFEAALREDPDYAQAWAGLADAYMTAGIGHELPPAQGFPKARQAAERALALDPGSAEAHTSRGHVYMLFDRDYARAEAEFAAARALDPAFARMWHHLALLRAFQGRVDEALASIRRARELEPMNLLYSSNYGLLLYHARRFDEAIAHARSLIEVQPALTPSRSVLIRALVSKGDAAAAEKELALRHDARPNLSDAGLVFARLGRRELALQEIQGIENLGRDGFGVGYEIAVVRAALGDVPGGCAALELALTDHSPFLGWMKLDPRLDALRNAPCFLEFERRQGGNNTR